MTQRNTAGQKYTDRGPHFQGSIIHTLGGRRRSMETEDQGASNEESGHMGWTAWEDWGS